MIVPGHHGSATATTWDLLQQTVPEYAVISCGAGNSYGHPHKDTMDKLSDMGIQKARQLLGPDYIIGGSAHNVDEALAAESAGADYIGCGAVFGSTTKTNVSQLPVETLKAICKAVKIPVVAIGGITHDNLPLLTGTGISGAAVISALYAPDNKTEAARTLLDIIERI